MEFIMGADISSLQAMEDCGAKYFDIDGKQKDAIEILKEHGVNYIRLRIWNNPTTSFDRGDYCNLENTLLMAKRVKEAGLKLLLDFHYCDSWADWKSQTIPAAWRGQNEKELADSVYVYTKQVLKALAEENAYPEMVQIGNEIGCGLLWDFGNLEHPENMALFLNHGIKAVREMQQENERTEVMIHIECGADVPRCEAFFKELEKHGVTDYDVIGLSYYPYWAGSYENFSRNLKNIAKHFGRPVVVTETAFPFTDESNDDTPNVVTSKLTEETMGLTASVENQRKVLEDVIGLVKKEKNGYGIFYWEPVWYNVKGVGAMKGVGNEWENQAMFDKNGRALDSLHAFEM
ncbi:MAG: arabinogalactan endo-beta-1,4-galactanase [Roseburia sp.]